MEGALFISGAGQDDACLAELRLEKGYAVQGMKRHASLFNTDRIDHLCQPPYALARHFVLQHFDVFHSDHMGSPVEAIVSDRCAQEPSSGP